MFKNNPADTSLKENKSIDTTFDLFQCSWDTTFKNIFERMLWLMVASNTAYPQLPVSI